MPKKSDSPLDHTPLILDYYNSIAGIYDTDRFNNSYGRHIDKQEQHFLSGIFNDPAKAIDLGCGTGRFLQYAGQGIDISEEMLKIAREKYPDKALQVADACNTPFPDHAFSNALCMHVVMHLSKEKVLALINEAGRILETGGSLVFDFPSQKRRRLFHKHTHQWHGSTEYSLATIKQLTRDQWRFKTSTGILFLPVHRFPKRLRKYLIAIDSWLCRSFLKEFSSYIIVVLEKK